METKTCRDCHETKPVSEYTRHTASPDGYRYICKSCWRDRYLVRGGKSGKPRRLAGQRRLDPAAATEKRCPICGRTLPVGAFSRNRSSADGRNAYCKPCWSEHYHDPERAWENQIRRNYGITRAEYERMLAAQGGLCGLCGGETNGKGKLHVDHDHETGKVRGLLCFRCNGMLGKIEKLGVEKVAAYLGG